LISQKDYEHIQKCEVWERDLELRSWNWVNGACVGWSQIVKCIGGFVVHQGKN